ncbi:MAG: hypothetical protein ACE5KE_05180 [Methanosarcinales archaeon]
MMSDRIGQMKQDIKIATAFSIAVFFVLIIWLISPKWPTNFFKDLHGWVDITKWVFPLILIALTSLFIFLDTHNWFDKKIFKERKKLDDFIREKITEPCRKISCNRARKGILINEENNLMDLFYTLIPSDDTERERAFNYWTQYFITVNSIIFSFFTILIALAYITILYYSNNILKIFHPAIIFILVLTILLNLARIRMKTKLIDPAKAQTKRILSDNKNDLKRKLPNYRINCQNCPFGSK